jgi:4-amino-4-deoxy-L-arabinose transferase-like glycosyltransferase
MLAAFAMLLQSFASESLVYAPLLGFFLGLAYLAKSFAFVVAFLTIAVMMLFQAWVQRRKLLRVVAGGALAFVVFAAVAGPYIAALSRQKGRFDFGDSGALNYAWYVSGTDKMHLEPWMTDSFGSASVKLVHPEQQLLARPGIYSYRAEPYGTYPAWFDPTYFHERIVPRFNLQRLVHRDSRNVALSLRYLLNHPEAWILLALLLSCGARFGFAGAGNWRHTVFWLPPVGLGLAMWGIYGLVNVEERYVTLAYLVIILPLFAALQTSQHIDATDDNPWPRRAATAMIALLAFLALGESLRVALEERRNESAAGLPAAWYSPAIFGAAKALNALGVGSGDEIACMGTIACLNDPYWMRLADVRVLTEVYNPDATHLLEEFEGLPNRPQVEDVLKQQRAKVLIAAFDPGEMTGRTPASAGWIRLGESNLYALPLNIPAPAPTAPATLPWDMTGAAKP